MKYPAADNTHRPDRNERMTQMRSLLASLLVVSSIAMVPTAFAGEHSGKGMDNAHEMQAISHEKNRDHSERTCPSSAANGVATLYGSTCPG